MDEDKTIDVICKVYSLTVYVQSTSDSNPPNAPLTGVTLTLTRSDGVNLTDYDLTPKTTGAHNSTHARYVWSQLANQSSSYTVTADTSGSGGAKSSTTSLTEDTEIIIQLIFPIGSGIIPGGPSPTFPTPSPIIPYLPEIKPVIGFGDIFKEHGLAIVILAGISVIFAIPFIGKEKKNGIERYKESYQSEYKRKKKKRKK